jgi:hypothetical protein
MLRADQVMEVLAKPTGVKPIPTIVRKLQTDTSQYIITPILIEHEHSGPG